MNRREMMTAVGGVAALSAASALGQVKAAPAAGPVASAAPLNKALIDAAEHCAATGRDCLELCIRTLASGDKMMAECAGTVRQMLPLCAAVAELARLKSPLLKAVAAACAKACRECEASCQKHAGHHAECKACQESCKACAAECEKLA